MPRKDKLHAYEDWVRYYLLIDNQRTLLPQLDYELALKWANGRPFAILEETHRMLVRWTPVPKV